MIALAQQSNILDFPSVAPQGKSNEWYTPARYVDAAREVMGSIDLDPASCEVANRNVKATRYYSIKDNGLEQAWYGNVWLNPPYGKTDNKSNQRHFVLRLFEAYQSGDVTQAILLSMSKTTNPWFHLYWDHPICFTEKNISFWLPGPNNRKRYVESHIHGSIFVYLGPNEQKFIDIFSQFGTIAKRVSPPRHTIATPSLWEVAE